MSAQGYRFAATQGGVIGAIGQGFENQNMNGMRGRGDNANQHVTFGNRGQKFSAGQGGVETYPGCYGLPTYCGWQQVGGVNDIAGTTAGVVTVLPTVSPYFEPKAVYMFGIDPAAPGTNLRFTIGSVTVGGSPQMALNNLAPTGGTIPAAPELLSDVFNRSDEPLLCNWSVFSTTGLARELQVNIFNLNGQAIRIFIVVWGNAVSSLDCYA